MTKDDDKAIVAAQLYSEDDTFKDIADKLETSKSHAQVLVRRGIALINSKNIAPRERTQENPGPPDLERINSPPGLERINSPPDLERTNPPYYDEYPLSFPQSPRPGSYTLETAGIPKRIILTPKALMVFEIWTSCGFDGDLSDFLEDAVNYLYETRKPEDRRNYG